MEVKNIYPETNSILAILNKNISKNNYLPKEILCLKGVHVITLFDFSSIKDKPYFNQNLFRQIINITYENNIKLILINTLNILLEKKIIEFISDESVSLPAKISGYLGFDKYYALEKVNAYKAMNFHTSKRVKVGIIDSGIYPHNDLLKNLSTGWNFVDDIVNTTNDTINHGTLVAGIIGANGSEVHGICKNVTIIPLKVSNNYGFFEMSAVIKAINYAIINDIPILNYCNSSDFYDVALYTSIKNYGGLFVCSAGNRGFNIDNKKRYPPSLNLENIISVAATDENDNILESSNFGENTVHLAAPGSNVYTTSSLSRNRYAKPYILGNGTSVAAPFVTATAALIKNLHNDASTAFIKNSILKSVDKKQNLKDKVISSGRLNIYNALQI